MVVNPAWTFIDHWEIAYIIDMYLMHVNLYDSQKILAYHVQKVSYIHDVSISVGISCITHDVVAIPTWNL